MSQVFPSIAEEASKDIRDTLTSVYKVLYDSCGHCHQILGSGSSSAMMLHRWPYGETDHIPSIALTSCTILKQTQLADNVRYEVLRTQKGPSTISN